MLNEQIKYEIAKQLDDKLKELKTFINPIENIIANSEFRCLGFGGAADGTNLTPGFDVNVYEGKNILIKSIQIIPYADDVLIDTLFSDGTNEAIPANRRINRVFDTFLNTGTFGEHTIKIIINGSQVIFSNVIDEGCPSPDFELNNIFFHYKGKVQSINVQFNTEVDSDLNVTTVIPLVKVFIECYLF